MTDWRTVPNFENYEVSDDGQVRNKRTGQLRKPQPHSSGYFQLMLHKKNKAYNQYIHRLVAEVFLDAVPGNSEVNHKNSNKRDNRAENLEYVTRRGNIRHAIANGRFVFRPSGVPRTVKSGKLDIIQ